MLGRIHSKESFGTVDGPGIRYVVFMQGCPMRCLYCHNPDTWEIGTGTLISAEDIITEFEKNRQFYKNGGITVTGGEPLLQVDFLLELFKMAKERNIHTCIDTSGAPFNKKSIEFTQKLDKLLEYTDLVMLDIKHIENSNHKELTGHGNSNILCFARYLEEKSTPIWIRHVVLEGYTDNPIFLEKLGEFIGSLSNLKALDVIPYHTLGEEKYKILNKKYPLEGIPPLSADKLAEAKKYIINGIKKAKRLKNSI